MDTSNISNTYFIKFIKPLLFFLFVSNLCFSQDDVVECTNQRGLVLGNKSVQIKEKRYVELVLQQYDKKGFHLITKKGIIKSLNDSTLIFQKNYERQIFFDDDKELKRISSYFEVEEVELVNIGNIVSVNYTPKGAALRGVGAFFLAAGVGGYFSNRDTNHRPQTIL